MPVYNRVLQLFPKGQRTRRVQARFGLHGFELEALETLYNICALWTDT